MHLTYEKIYMPYKNENPIIDALLENNTVKNSTIDDHHSTIDFSTIANALNIEIPYSTNDPFQSSLYYKENAEAIIDHLIDPFDDVDKDTLNVASTKQINDAIASINKRSRSRYLDQLMYPNNLVEYHISQWVKIKNNGQLSLCQVSENELVAYVQRKLRCTRMRAFIMVQQFITQT